MSASLHSRFFRTILAMGMCIACTSCSSGEAARPPSAAPATSGAPAPMPCSSLLGNWIEVETTDGTTADHPEEDKVRPIEPATLLDVEPGRMIVTKRDERLYTSFGVEQLSDGSCMLHARDSKGKPLDMTVAFPSERLMRLHNVLEFKSAGTLYERR